MVARKMKIKFPGIGRMMLSNTLGDFGMNCDRRGRQLALSGLAFLKRHQVVVLIRLKDIKINFSVDMYKTFGMILRDDYLY